MNDALARVLGIAAASASGRALPDLLGTIDDDGRAAFARAAQTGALQRVAITCAPGRSETRRLGLTIMPAEDGLLTVIGQDITQRWRQEQQEAATQALLAKVFLVVDAAVALVADSERVLMTNPALDRLLGYPAGAIVGRRSLDFVAPECRAIVEDARARQGADRQAYELVVDMLAADGTRPRVRLASVLVDNRDLYRVRVVTLTPARRDVPAEPAVPRRVMVAGKIQLVGLTAVKQALGARWPEVAERALQTAEHVVRRRLGPADSFSRTEDDGILICFGTLNEAEASFRAAEIGREIRERLIGVTDEPAASRVTAITASLPLDEHEQVPAAQMLESMLTARRREIEIKARETLKTTLAGLCCEITDVQQRDGSVVARALHLSAAAEERILTALAALQPTETAEFDLDLLRMRLATERLAEFGSNGLKTPVLIDVGFDIFDTRACTERYLAFGRTLSPKFRDALILLLTGWPRDLLADRLQDRIQRLQPVCRRVGFVTGGLAMPPLPIPPPAITTMAACYGDLAAEGSLEPKTLSAHVARLGLKRGRLLVRDVPDAAAARALWSCGVELIGMRAE